MTIHQVQMEYAVAQGTRVFKSKFGYSDIWEVECPNGHANEYDLHDALVKAGALIRVDINPVDDLEARADALARRIADEKAKRRRAGVE